MALELPELGIGALQQELAAGRCSSVALCRAFLERIADLDRAGPTLRAVIEENPDALEIAAALDRERAERGPRGPLHGVPVLIKDAIDTADRMQTTAGSLALEGNFAPRDAGVVARLRAAGAVLLGKTNMSEWGYMRSSRGCSGWSSRGGQVRNPYALDRSPSGSSSGSAVAVAANLCSVAIGAEVDGSVVRPSACNSLVGIKPSVGLVSRAGIIGVADPQDTAGPMGRSVADVAVLLSVLAGPDPRDPVTLRAGEPPDYCAALDADALRGARLGVDRNYFGYHEGVDAVIEDAIRELRARGAEIVDPVETASLSLFGGAEMELLLYGLKAALNRYLAEHPKARVRSLEELIEFNRTHADRVMPYFQQDLLERAQAKGGLDESAHLAALTECRRISRDDGIDKALREQRLDAIVAPTDSTPPWVIDPIVGDNIHGGCAPLPAMAGYPHVTVPAGYVFGLPVGLSFYAGAFQEAKLLAYAHAFEQATRVRRRPGFAPTAALPGATPDRGSDGPARAGCAGS